MKAKPILLVKLPKGSYWTQEERAETLKNILKRETDNEYHIVIQFVSEMLKNPILEVVTQTFKAEYE